MTTHFHRNGPSPLWLHLNGGATMMAAASEDKNMLHAATEMLNEAMNGVKAYHDHPARPYKRKMTLLAEQNGTRLLSAKPWTGDKPIVLLIPSLINEWHIFDIEKDHSFAAFIAANGFMPVIVDWATPDDNISINDYISTHLAPLMQDLQKNKAPIHSVIGYCMGATFIPALYSAYPDIMKPIKRAVMIAPPWDFSYQSIDQQMRLQSLAVQTYAMGDIVPNDFVQSLFWAVDPLQVLKKFRKFPHVTNPDRFVRVEDWLNAGRAVSKSVIQTCLFDWYRDNNVVNGRWKVNDVRVTQDALPQHTMIIAGDNDMLVPKASITPLITDRRPLITVPTGHIGLMASDKGLVVWEKLVNFIK